jgi:hypothetical protein
VGSQFCCTSAATTSLSEPISTIDQASGKIKQTADKVINKVRDTVKGDGARLQRLLQGRAPAKEATLDQLSFHAPAAEPTTGRPRTHAGPSHRAERCPPQ